MKIQSQLHIGNHPTNQRTGSPDISFDNGEPHAMGLIKVPFDEISSHPKTQEIYNALPEDAKEFVREEGNLAISHDFTFLEDYKDGLGLIVEDLSLDVSRLKGAEKEQIAGWMQEQYGVQADNDAALQQNVGGLKSHIITDMSFAGMSQDNMLGLIAEHTEKPAQERDYGLVPAGDMDNMYQSLQTRLGLSDTPDLSAGSEDRQKIEAYHDNVQSMKEHWPNPEAERYGGETPGEGEVIFFKGFEATGGEYVKSGPYAYSAAWPLNAEYDENGIARDDEGNVVAPKDIKLDEDYVYPPHSALSATLEGNQATQVLDNLFAGGTTVYDGYDRNCAGVTGRAVMGETFDQIPERGSKNDKLWSPDHLQTLEQNGQLPDGMQFHDVSAKTEGKVSQLDQNALKASTDAVQEQHETAQSKQALASLAGVGDVIDGLRSSASPNMADQPSAAAARNAAPKQRPSGTTQLGG